MRLNRKKLRSIVMLTVAAVFFCTFSVMASTRQEQGSLTIFYHGVTPKEENIALSGAGFSLYPIASRKGNTWIYLGDFSECRVPLTDMSASGQQKAAKSIYAYVQEKNLKGTMQKTDVSGRTTYTSLEEAMYLIVPEGDVACNGGVFRSAPFLVRIPETDNHGNPIYDVLVEPKNEWVSGGEQEKPQTPTEKPDKKPTQEPEIPEGNGSDNSGISKPGKAPSGTVQTGDNTPIMTYAVLAAWALLFLVAAKGLKEKRKN